MPGSNTRKRRTSLNKFLWVVPVIDPFVYLRDMIERNPYTGDVRIVDLVSDVKGEDIVLIDLRELTPISDYFVICSGTSTRQIEAIWQEISETLKKEGVNAYRREGDADAGWILIDLGDVVVHIFSPPQREYYRLDDLWSNAKTVLRIQ